jgi:NADH dehydrogenase [ubiquinone] 1 alpha subcomplex assembly factor 5
VDRLLDDPGVLRVSRGVGEAGKVDDVQMRAQELCLGVELRTIEPRHPDVGDHQIDVTLGENADGLVPIARGHHHISRRREDLRDDIPHQRVVIDNQDDRRSRHLARRNEQAWASFRIGGETHLESLQCCCWSRRARGDPVDRTPTTPVAPQAARGIYRAMAVPPDPIRVFDRAAVRAHRARAARRPEAAKFLIAEAAARLADRLDDVTRRFPRALDLGSRDGVLARLVAGRGGIETLVHADAAFGYARLAPAPALVAEAEALPFHTASFDLVLSNLELHWTNDLPGALLQLRQALKPDGLLLASLFGGETLRELRRAFLEAELEEEGGASPRVAPFADVRDLGMLLQRAGFALPVVDSDSIDVTYGDALALMRELRAMGESNAVGERRRSFTRRATLLGAGRRYHELFAGPDGRVPAHFEIVTLTAWAPDASQPRPLKPGSARTSLAAALGAQERPAGE